ncbi:Conserved_hypothetical protein [Hexamita inflata]|uniref:Uncharacterized protein n=2 Tax=Hexamita inflata TaxID=28002 RepID=A0AA86PNG3_9EUKA|nr:Conserved hypothetical protein [Hexamita inflata]
MQTLKNLRYTFYHDGPVLSACADNIVMETYFSLTATTLYYWYRDSALTDHPYEADFISVQYSSPHKVKFRKLVVINNYAIVGDSSGKIQIFQPRELKQKMELLLVQQIMSHSSDVLDMKMSNNQLYVLHANLMSVFRDFYYQMNARVTQPKHIKLQLKAHLLSAILDQNVVLLFVADSNKIKIYMDQCEDEVTLTHLGYLSEDIQRPDVATMDTTAVSAKNSIVLTGNKTGNITIWTFHLVLSADSVKLQFKQVMSTWQNGIRVSCVQLSPFYLLSFSFDEDGCCVVMDMKYNKVVNKFIPHAKLVTSAQLYQEQGLLLTGSLDYTVKLWNVWVKE